ncbi:MAG: hypothetical protein KAR45_14655, partial [Desulfobacteraceae bacterium]|nr:hypothetical protein [Desulfobacteraceae bacterium]
DYKNIGNPTGMIARWSRLSYFIFVVDKWSDDPKFKNQVKERSLGWGSLKEAYISLIETMVNFRDKNIDMSQDEEDELSKQIDHLLANCYRLISCVVIMTSKATEDPLLYINEIGLKVHPDGQIYTRRGEVFRIVFALVPTIIILAILYALFVPGTGPREIIHDIIVYVVSAGIIMIFPIILVVALKRHLAIGKIWRVVTPENPYKSFFDMPLGIYVMISALAWGISLILMMLFMNDKGVMESNEMVWKSVAIFCFISAITAFITCYRSDIPPKIFKRKVNLLFTIFGFSVLHGTFTALTVWVGLIMSGSEPGSSALWQYPLLGFSISLAIGFTLFYGKHKVEHRST